MGKVVFDISMSLDGFMTAANQKPEEPLGIGGRRLHEWAFGDDQRDREVLAGRHPSALPDREVGRAHATR